MSYYMATTLEVPFDEVLTRVVEALKEEGFEVVLINSNPATIMTDPGMAEVTYIEPLNAKVITEIIAKERPDALLPNLGGQSGLNLSSELHQLGVLEEYGVKIIGVNIDAIQRGEDRLIFKETMDRLGIETPASRIVGTVADAAIELRTGAIRHYLVSRSDPRLPGSSRWRLSPERIESVIASCAGVQDCRVRMSDDRLVAEVVYDDSLSQRELLAFVAARSPSYALPDEVVKVKRVPRTDSGKIRRY